MTETLTPVAEVTEQSATQVEAPATPTDDHAKSQKELYAHILRSALVLRPGFASSTGIKDARLKYSIRRAALVRQVVSALFDDELGGGIDQLDENAPKSINELFDATCERFANNPKMIEDFVKDLRTTMEALAGCATDAYQLKGRALPRDMAKSYVNYKVSKKMENNSYFGAVDQAWVDERLKVVEKK